MKIAETADFQSFGKVHKAFALRVDFEFLFGTKRIRKETSPKAFAMFTLLLQEIDQLAGVKIDYLE